MRVLSAFKVMVLITLHNAKELHNEADDDCNGHVGDDIKIQPKVLNNSSSA